VNKAILLVFSLGFEWLLFSLALYGLAKKLNWNEKWSVWVPGLRFVVFADAVNLNQDGSFCATTDILYIAGTIVDIVAPGIGRAVVAVALISLILYVFFYMSRIRIFVRYISLFGLRKRWIVLWLLSNWIPIMIIGFGKKYQPRTDIRFEEAWEAGTKPADIPAAQKKDKDWEAAGEGLSINLKEKTVKDHRKKRYLLKDIALNIPNKSLVMLLGGSGAGKTTFINAVIGYEKADATVLLNGSDVYKHYNSVKYRIGYVPQQNLIRGKDTVFRTINDAAKLRLPATLTKEERRQRVAEVMDTLGLTSGSEGLVANKSGGQLRRISIAMELVTDPELFVLDEPDSGLDGVIAREIFGKLRDIADEGRIVIVITHTPDRVVDLFDKVIVLARDSGRVGRLAFYGTPDEAREFFGKDTMEGIVMSVNSKAQGGEGLADEIIGRFAERTEVQEAEVAS